MAEEMMRVSGVVQKVEDGFAWVEVTPAGGCGRCHEPGGCGGVSITRALETSRKTYRLPNDAGCVAGEQVGVVIEDGVALRAALLTYGLPVVGVIAGAALGTTLGAPARGDLGGLLGAVLGLTAGFLAGRGGWGARTSPVRLVRDGGGAGCGA